MKLKREAKLVGLLPWPFASTLCLGQCQVTDWTECAQRLFLVGYLWLRKMVNGLTHHRSREGGLRRTFFSCSLGKKLKENKNKEAKEFVLPRCFIYFSFGLKRSCQLFFQPF
jgi:hypothetical protein